MSRYSVAPERAGDGTLYEVRDLTGRVVSAHPCSLRAAQALADHLEADAEDERRRDEKDNGS